MVRWCGVTNVDMIASQEDAILVVAMARFFYQEEAGEQRWVF